VCDLWPRTRVQEEEIVGMMMKRMAVAALAAFALVGCAALREDPIACRAVMTGIGAAVGATMGGVGVHEWESGPEDWEIAAGAGGGLVGGGLVGYLIGYYTCPEEVVVAAPPPPPPPAGTKVPPPATERRGG
jgi:hypothetical protein